MKRSALLRRSPLARGESKLLTRSPMKRSRLVSRVKVRTEAEGGDPAYLAFVRRQPCCRCGAVAPNHAHHEILNGRGKGQKSPDARALPLCAGCHSDFHGVAGRFKNATVEQRRDFQDVEITRLRSVWAVFQETGVLAEPAREAV